MKGTRKEPLPQMSSLSEIKRCMYMDTTWSPMKESEASISSKFYIKVHFLPHIKHTVFPSQKRTR